jgi:hypothetical protein
MVSFVVSIVWLGMNRFLSASVSMPVRTASALISPIQAR